MRWKVFLVNSEIMNKLILNEQNDPRKYVGYGEDGEWYNKEYPPNPKKYGKSYGGYKTPVEEALFQLFAVNGDDIILKYHGNNYALRYSRDAFFLGQRWGMFYDNKIGEFKDPMDLIRNLEIEGKKLIDIIPDIEEIDPV